jgi:hypothetical protein
MFEENPQANSCPGELSLGGRYVELQLVTEDDFPILMGFRDLEHDKMNMAFYVTINTDAGVDNAKVCIYDFLMMGTYPSYLPTTVQ